MVISKYKRLPYPRNLWSCVFDREVQEHEIPIDWKETLERLFKTLGDEQQVFFLLYFYRDDINMPRIGVMHNCGYEKARRQIVTALTRLQHPSRRHIMEHGLAKAEVMRKNKEGYWACDIKSIEDIDPEILAASISTLELSFRAYGCLRRYGISTIGQLSNCTISELKKIRNMGPQSIDEICRSLARFGLSI